MRTPRILCEELSSPSIHYTNIKQIHHLAKVLRVKLGDSVQLFDGKGNFATAKINELTKQSIHFLIDEVYKEKNPYNINYQAIFPYIKKDNLIFLIQKLTEIGINSLVLFKPDHIDQSLVKKDPSKLNKKIEEHKANLVDDFSMIKDFAINIKKQEELMKWIEKTISNTYIKINNDISACEFKNKWVK